MTSIRKNEHAKKVILVDSKTNFDKMIAEAGNKHILVEFYATWCGPCAIIGPRLEQLANEYADRLVILKIDVDDHEELAVEYEVTSMPTFLIIKNKVKLVQFVGSNSEKVESTLEKYCGKPDNITVPTKGSVTVATGPKAGTSRQVKETSKSSKISPTPSPPESIEKKFQTKP